MTLRLKMERITKSKLNSFIKTPLFTFYAIFVLFISGVYVNNSNAFNVYFISISLGLLGFIQIFYQLIVGKTTLVSKKEKILEEEWDKVCKTIKLTKLNGTKYQQQLEIVDKLQDGLEKITSIEEELDIKLNVKRTTYGFIFTILLFFIDLITGWKYVDPQTGNFLAIRILGSFCFFYSLYYVYLILNSWYLLSDDK